MKLTYCNSATCNVGKGANMLRGLYSPPHIPRGVLAESSDKIRTFFGWNSSQSQKSESEFCPRTVLGRNLWIDLGLLLISSYY